ncbi:hypothetical protein pb186bvf_002510 [Paramecium bursaria]
MLQIIKSFNDLQNNLLYCDIMGDTYFQFLLRIFKYFHNITVLLIGNCDKLDEIQITKYFPSAQYILRYEISCIQ